MYTYEATVKVTNSSNTFILKTQVNAETAQEAYYLLEGQYGTGCVLNYPQQTS